MMESNSKNYYQWVNQMFSGHNRTGIEMNMSVEELTMLAKNTTECKLCGKKFDWSKLKETPKEDKPSMDRINNDRVLTIDKVQIVCVRCNYVKMDLSNNEIIYLCRNIVNKNRDMVLTEKDIMQLKESRIKIYVDRRIIKKIEKYNLHGIDGIDSWLKPEDFLVDDYDDNIDKRYRELCKEIIS